MNAATARLLVVCLAAAPASVHADDAPAGNPPPAEAAAPQAATTAVPSPRVEARRPPPAVLVLPLLGPVLLPLALPTTNVPARKRTVELPRAGTDGSGPASDAVPEVRP